MGEQAELKNRIVGRGKMDPTKLVAHPLNFRLHPDAQKTAVLQILEGVGWVQDILVNRRSGFMLNGHMRRDIAIARKETRVPITFVDLSPEEEKIVLASFDPIGGMAVVDDEQLASLLAEASMGDNELTQMLEALLGEAREFTLKEPTKPKDGAAPSDRPARQLGDRKAQIKPVLYAPQVEIFEDALRLTGEANRGRALIMICDFFVKSNQK